MLHKKTIHELRAIAQGYGVPDLFGKSVTQLVQAIELKQQGMVVVADPLPARPEYDARLMTRSPSRKTDESEITALLQPYITRGLHLTFPEPEQWHMRWGVREDTGTTRMPLRAVLRCAEVLFAAK